MGYIIVSDRRNDDGAIVPPSLSAFGPVNMGAGAEENFGRLHHRLGECWVRMDRHCDIARQGSHLDHQFDRVRAVLDVFKEKLVRRNVSLKSIDHEEPVPAGGSTSRLLVSIKEGLDDEKAKAVVRKLKEAGPKGVNAQRQGETVRVSSKKRDDLQAAIALLKGEDFGVPLLSFNYR